MFRQAPRWLAGGSRSSRKRLWRFRAQPIILTKSAVRAGLDATREERNHAEQSRGEGFQKGGLRFFRGRVPIEEKFELDARYKRDPPDMSFAEYRIHSGQPAGYRIAGPYARAPTAYYDWLWFEGHDSDLFAPRIANDPDNDPATGYAWEYVALRPMPEGEYKAFVNFQYSAWRPCDYNPEADLNTLEATIIAAAPDGVIHEAFFDPAALKGGAAGADASDGVLAPADFAFGGAGASLASIRWRSQTVEMRLSPHTRLRIITRTSSRRTARRPASGFRRRLRNGRRRVPRPNLEGLRPAVARRRYADAPPKRKPNRPNRRGARRGLFGVGDARKAALALAFSGACKGRLESAWRISGGFALLRAKMPEAMRFPSLKTCFSANPPLQTLDGRRRGCRGRLARVLAPANSPLQETPPSPPPAPRPFGRSPSGAALPSRPSRCRRP